MELNELIERAYEDGLRLELERTTETVYDTEERLSPWSYCHFLIFVNDKTGERRVVGEDVFGTGTVGNSYPFEGGKDEVTACLSYHKGGF